MLRFKALVLAMLTGSLLAVASPAFASHEKVLYSFCPTSCQTDGDFPFSTPIFDAAGNLYGTTYEGGQNDSGTVFELSQGPGGAWTETTLFNFPNCEGFGSLAGLTFDASGNLYGTTFGCGSAKGGTVFELSHGSSGWSYQVLHNFGIGHDGWALGAAVIFDSAGNIYGTTNEGGQNGSGIVFELSPNDGQWTEKILYNFGSFGRTNSVSNLITDTAGNLYGTSALGGGAGCGGSGCGIVFELSPSSNGHWTERVLHKFNGVNGANPISGVIFDGAGNLYGTTANGGRAGCNPPVGCGTVFELSPGTAGHWTERVIRFFDANPKNPTGNLVFDTAGNLYGTTSTGGGTGCNGGGCGKVFKLTPAGNGTWTFSTLHIFLDNHKDGNTPYAGLVLDSAGNLYGTTYQGGSGIWNVGCGTVFEITP
jgi:uncharacterized repeat protein (TIGR03803 family)